MAEKGPAPQTAFSCLKMRVPHALVGRQCVLKTSMLLMAVPKLVREMSKPLMNDM